MIMKVFFSKARLQQVGGNPMEQAATQLYAVGLIIKPVMIFWVQWKGEKKIALLLEC